EQRLVGDLVELLHRFALDVLLAHRAEYVGQAGAADLVGDDLRGQGDARQQPREFARGARVVAALLLDDVLLERHQIGDAHPTRSWWAGGSGPPASGAAARVAAECGDASNSSPPPAWRALSRSSACGSWKPCVRTVPRLPSGVR